MPLINKIAVKPPIDENPNDSKEFNLSRVIQLLEQLNKLNSWNKEKIGLRDRIIEELKKTQHVEFEAGCDYYGYSKVGEYSDWGKISKKKQGHLKPLANKNVLFVCVGSGIRWKRQYIAAAY
mgnify:CR=1 FL=1